MLSNTIKRYNMGQRDAICYQQLLASGTCRIFTNTTYICCSTFVVCIMLCYGLHMLCYIIGQGHLSYIYYYDLHML